jgi:hypothetical protein
VSCRVAFHKALEVADGRCRADQPQAVGSRLSVNSLTILERLMIAEVVVCGHGHFDKDDRRGQVYDCHPVGHMTWAGH